MKYYLYDIQNERRVCEVNDTLYYALKNCIFNKEMIKVIVFYIMNCGDDEWIYNIDSRVTLNALNYFIFNTKSHNESMYKIIKIRIDK